MVDTRQFIEHMDILCFVFPSECVEFGASGSQRRLCRLELRDEPLDMGSQLFLPCEVVLDCLLGFGEFVLQVFEFGFEGCIFLGKR